MGQEVATWINKYIKEQEGCEIQNFTMNHEAVGWCPLEFSTTKLILTPLLMPLGQNQSQGW